MRFILNREPHFAFSGFYDNADVESVAGIHHLGLPHSIRDEKTGKSAHCTFSTFSLPPKYDFKVVDDKERKVTNKVGLLNA